MSNIIRELFKDELLEARTEASAEGRAEGRAEGHLEMLTNLVRKGLLSAADAAKELSISETKFRTFFILCVILQSHPHGSKHLHDPVPMYQRKNSPGPYRQPLYRFHQTKQPLSKAGFDRNHHSGCHTI